MRPTIVVIGAGGMGLAIARRQGGGRRVLLADYSQQALDSASAILESEGFEVVTSVVDVSSWESMTDLAQVAASLGADQLAHTAGLSPVQASAQQILEVDLFGVINSLVALEPVLAPGGAGVVIASMAGTVCALDPQVESTMQHASVAELRAHPMLDPAILSSGAAYGIAKRGAQLRVRVASAPWARRGLRINSVSPGVISTPMGRQELAASGDAMESIVSGSALGRLGNATEIANATAFLLSADASFVTGTDLLVDGGAIAAGSIPPKRGE